MNTKHETRYTEKPNVIEFCWTYHGRIVQFELHKDVDSRAIARHACASNQPRHQHTGGTPTGEVSIVRCTTTANYATGTANVAAFCASAFRRKYAMEQLRIAPSSVGKMLVLRTVATPIAFGKVRGFHRCVDRCFQRRGHLDRVHDSKSATT